MASSLNFKSVVFVHALINKEEERAIDVNTQHALPSTAYITDDMTRSLLEVT